MGRAVITTDAPGCRETVQDGKTGFLVPVKDGKAVAEKMIYFIRNPEQVAVMGAASKAYCDEKFAVEKINERMLQYLKVTNM